MAALAQTEHDIKRERIVDSISKQREAAGNPRGPVAIRHPLTGAILIPASAPNFSTSNADSNAWRAGRAPVLTSERDQCVMFRLAPLTARGGIAHRSLQPRETDL